MSEGVKDAYTSADTQALKRTGIQANRQAAYIHIIPPRLKQKLPLNFTKQMQYDNKKSNTKIISEITESKVKLLLKKMEVYGES